MLGNLYTYLAASFGCNISFEQVNGVDLRGIQVHVFSRRLQMLDDVTFWDLVRW